MIGEQSLKINSREEVGIAMMAFFIIPVLVTVLGGMSWYLSWRLYQGLETFVPELRFWPVAMIIGTLTLVMVLGFGRSFLPVSEGIKDILGVMSAYVMGILLYLLLFTVLADLLLLMPRLLQLSFTKHHLFKGFVTLGVFLLTLITCVGGFVNGHGIDHVSYEIPIENKSDISELKVVMISDLHLGAVGSERRLEKIVGSINAQEPDLVCIAGDFFDTDFTSIRDPEKALETIRKISATYGVYACLGNHDGGQTYPQMVAFLEQANIQLLDDGYAVIDERLVVVGRLDAFPIGGYGDRKRKALSDIFTPEDPTLPVIVLDHNPTHISEYGTEADLILCGHTHKGQVFPGNLITGAMYAVDHGYYRKDSQSPHVIVTSGVGTWGMPMRVGTNCEIVSIRFSQ